MYMELCKRLAGNLREKEVSNMPNRDGTGPKGQGARTGRGLGSCKTTTSTTSKPKRKPAKGTGKGRGRNI